MSRLEKCHLSVIIYCWFQPPKCEDLQLLSVLCFCKLNMFADLGFELTSNLMMSSWTLRNYGHFQLCFDVLLNQRINCINIHEESEFVSHPLFVFLHQCALMTVSKLHVLFVNDSLYSVFNESMMHSYTHTEGIPFLLYWFPFNAADSLTMT